MKCEEKYNTYLKIEQTLRNQLELLRPLVQIYTQDTHVQFI